MISCHGKIKQQILFFFMKWPTLLCVVMVVTYLAQAVLSIVVVVNVMERLITGAAYDVGWICVLSYELMRVTLQNAMWHIAPFTVKNLLYEDDSLDLTENKRIITETLRFISDSKRFAWLPRICYVSFLTLCVHHSLLIFHLLMMSIYISSLLVWISIKYVSVMN